MLRLMPLSRKLKADDDETLSLWRNTTLRVYAIRPLALQGVQVTARAREAA